MSFRRADKAIMMADWEKAAPQIWEKLGPYLDQIEVNGEDYLIVVFEHGEEMMSKLLLPPGYGKEGQHQGVAGLIVKAGPNVDAQADRFYGKQVPRVGQWIMYRGIDTVPFLFGPHGHMCRFVEASQVRAVLARPDLVF